MDSILAKYMKMTADVPATDDDRDEQVVDGNEGDEQVRFVLCIFVITRIK